MRRSLAALTLVLALPLVTATQTQEAAPALLARARELHKQVPLIDGHNDYPWALRENAGRDLDKLDITKPQPTIMTDIPRLRAGGVGGQFWSVYVSADDPAPVTTTLEQIDIVYRMMRKYPETFELALTADDVERIFKKGKIASLIGMEGGHSIDNSLGALRMFYRLGARYMTLTHSEHPLGRLGDRQAGAQRSVPVRRAGGPGDELAGHARRSFARLAGDDEGCDRRERGAGDFSHSSARALNDVPRNVPDDVL